METIWNDRQGSRDRSVHLVLVTYDGKPHTFKGNSIENVCHAIETSYEKNGKWSNTTYRIIHSESTAAVAWMDDWGTGRMFPQSSWEEGYLWVAEKAPMLDRELFQAWVRDLFSKTAERWNKAEAAFAQFGFHATKEQLEKIEANKLAIMKEKEEYEKAEKERTANSPFSVLLSMKT